MFWFRNFLFVFFLLVSFSSYSNTAPLKSITNIKLNDSIHTLKVKKIDQKYLIYFDGSKLGKNNDLQLENTKESHGYIPGEIRYKIYLQNVHGIMYHPKSQGDEVNILSTSRKIGNSLFIETSQEDNGNYNFLLKYDYNMQEERIKLSHIFYIVDLRKKYGYFKTVYTIGNNIPETLIYLDKFNENKYYEFIKNKLYKNINHLKLTYVSIPPNYQKEIIPSDSLCTLSEKTIFSCQLENTKYVSFCSSENSSVYYRYGTLQHIELEHKFNVSSPLNHTTHSNSDSITNDHYFNIGSYQYMIRSIKYLEDSIYDPKDISLSVKKGNKKIFERSCVNVSRYFE